MSANERPAKRARQACDPCRYYCFSSRRKKSRCPGEKPVCSYCARLRQQCTYSDDASNHRQSISDNDMNTSALLANTTAPHITSEAGNETSQRLNDLEAKLSEVLVALQESKQQANADHHSPVPTLPQSSPTRRASSLHFQSSSPLQQPISHIADLYLAYCHCQPLPLFSPDQFSTRLALRDEEIIFSVSAIAIRYSEKPGLDSNPDESSKGYCEKARNLTIQRVINGPIELSTLQSLCLLSWLDFYDGNTHRAGMYTSLVSDLCKSSNLAGGNSPDGFIQEEKLRCFWSIVLLQRLHPNITGPFHISFDEDGMPPYPKSPSRPVIHTAEPTSEGRISDHKDLGIVAYATQLTEVWYKVARYAHRRASAGPHPPWSPKSEYAKIIAHQMNSETAMPYSKHRFKPAKFEERTSEELSQHRDYWGPWLFAQVLYHTIICVLNHPLLLSLRLQTFRVASIPELWLQHTDDLITQHSQWVVHLIDLAKSKAFSVSDPFLAHCVAIVATIYLQQSFGDDNDIQLVKKENFTKCLQFCQLMGSRWPYIQQIARKLQDFERVVSDSYLNSAASQANDKIFIDLTLFWEILESAAISENPDIDGINFGASLEATIRPPIGAEEVTARLLPEPSRVVAIGSPASGLVTQQTPNIIANTIFTPNYQPFMTNDDFNVLAQSYFAQGQDFVGNMDDWWLMDNSAQPG